MFLAENQSATPQVDSSETFRLLKSRIFSEMTLRIPLKELKRDVSFSAAERFLTQENSLFRQCTAFDTSAKIHRKCLVPRQSLILHWAIWSSYSTTATW